MMSCKYTHTQLYMYMYVYRKIFHILVTHPSTNQMRKAAKAVYSEPALERESACELPSLGFGQDSKAGRGVGKLSSGDGAVSEVPC